MNMKKGLAGIVSGTLLVISLPITVGAAIMTGTQTDFTDVILQTKTTRQSCT